MNYFRLVSDPVLETPEHTQLMEPSFLFCQQLEQIRRRVPWECVCGKQNRVHNVYLSERVGF